MTLLGTGEMGIANTTSSSAMFAVLLPSDVESLTGRGTGIGDAALRKKSEVIKHAIEVNEDLSRTHWECSPRSAVSKSRASAACVSEPRRVGSRW